MIYLNCEIKSGLGEDTFWTWFHREFPNSTFDEPKKLGEKDILLRYSTLGFLPIEGKQMALCWELYPRMREKFNTAQWDSIISKVNECARYSTYRSVATKDTVSDYSDYGSVEVIPIGVDINVFKPLKNKRELRDKYNLPQDKKIGVWIGTTHPMKGFTKLMEYASFHPEIYWILIWKWEKEALIVENSSNFIQIPQVQVNELLNAGDFFLSTSQLRPYYMAEWEAMAADIPFVFYGNVEREFIPSNHPRNDVLELAWDRDAVKERWIRFFEENGVEW